MTITLEKNSPISKDLARRKMWRGVGLLALCGILLALSFPSWLPRGMAWVVGMVALVPWGICVTRRPMGWKWVGIYYLFGLLWFCINLYWLMWLTAGGTIGLSFFCAVWIALAAFGTQRILFHLRWPAMAAVPVVWVACEYLRGTVLSGFPWFLLGNSMTGNLVLLQMADLFGVWGVSFFCAMTAGWIVDITRLPLWRGGASGRDANVTWRSINPQIVRLSAAYGVMLAAAVGYGIFRLNQQTQVDGPVVAVVQADIPQDAEVRLDPEEVFGKYMALTEEAARPAGEGTGTTLPSEKPDLIVWPESSVLRFINGEWMALRFIDPETQKDVEDSRSMSDALAAEARRTGTNLLVGSVGIYLEDHPAASEPGYWVKNLAVLYTPGEGQVMPYYAKRHLVPFGEYIPFKSSWPWMNELLLKLMPKGFVPNNEPGEEWTRMAMADRGGKAYRFGTPICYEDVMPEPSQSFVEPGKDGKRIDFLINISNDGWYKSVNELDQHLQMSQMRAVENRVPMVRSVNPGNSGFVDSCGRIVKLVEKNGQTHFVTGTAQWKLRLDLRVSLFSRIGDLFGVLCGVVAGLAVAWTIVRPRRKTAEAVTVAG